MDSKTIPIILGAAIGLIVLINGALLLSHLRSRGSHPYRGALKLFKIARNPWKEEDRELEELRSRVAGLQKEAEKGHNSE
ncbi:MAG: hypothetical protein IIC78_02910 [Chloroflexi bacterium]|nr:hypothetical protein [Chloroflexota bacterium]